jgi:hypothetical protein
VEEGMEISDLTNEQLRNLTHEQIERIEEDPTALDEIMGKKEPKEEPKEEDSEDTDTSEQAEEDAANGKDEEEEEPVVLNKSGKGTIPYTKHKELRVENATLREELQNAKTRLEELLNNKIDAKTDKEEAKADDAIAKHLEVLKQDMPELHEVITSVLDGSRKQSEKLDAALAELQREKEATKKAEEKSVAEQVAEAKDNNPDLVLWETTDPEAWDEALRQDEVLRGTTKWAKAPYAERFAEVARRVRAVLPEAAAPNKPDSAEETKATAKAKLEKSPARKPKTLSDIPTGGDPSSEKDAVENLTPGQLTARLMKMPEQASAAMRAGLD